MFQFPWYASSHPMYSDVSDCVLPQPGFPIRTPPDQSLLTAPRGSFVVRHVLLRLLAPRHPPCALSSLTISLSFWAIRSVVRYFPDRINSTKVESNSQRIAYPKMFASITTFSSLALTQVQLKGFF